MVEYFEKKINKMKTLFSTLIITFKLNTIVLFII